MDLKNYPMVYDYLKSQTYTINHIKNSCRDNKHTFCVANEVFSQIGLSENKRVINEHTKEIASLVANLCGMLKLGHDKEGVMIFILYYFLGMRMEDIAVELSLSSRSCWRHLKNSVEELSATLCIVMQNA